MFEEVLLKACSQPEWVGTTTATSAREDESDAIARMTDWKARSDATARYIMIIRYK